MTESVSNAKGLIKKVLKNLKENGDIEMWAVDDHVTPYGMYRIDIWVDNTIRFTSAANNKCSLAKVKAWNEMIKLLIGSALKK